MADSSRTVRVRLSVRSALAVVFALAGTVLALELVHNAERVIAWVLCAAAIAALVYPAVDWLSRSRFIPRALAVVIIVLLGLGVIGFLGYRVGTDVSDAMTSLQQAAPKRAAELERNSDFFREIKLNERVTKFVDAIPKRLAGGEPTEAIKSAATQSVAFIAGMILTIFFIWYGPGLVDGAFGLLDDERTRERAQVIFRNGSRRGLFFARVKLWEAVVAGLLAYSIARVAGVPGPAALGVWVALWSLLPVGGVVIGALPVVVFAAAQSNGRAVAVAAAFVAMGFASWMVDRWLERRTVHVGSFPIVLAAFGGLELYGLTGALIFVLGAILAVSMIAEIGPEEVAEVLAPPAPAGAT